MEHLKLYILWLCFVISTAKLLGPEDQKKSENSEDEENTLNNIVLEGQADPEYYAEFTEAINKQIKSMQDQADAFKKSASSNKAEEDDSKGIINHIFYVKRILYRY